MSELAYPGEPFGLAVGEVREDIVTGYASAIEAGFSHAGSAVQIDLAALSRMTSVLAELRAGKANAHGGYWVLEDNSMVTLSDSEAVGLLEGAVARRLEIDQIYFAAREALNAAETVDEVHAVTVEFG